MIEISCKYKVQLIIQFDLNKFNFLNICPLLDLTRFWVDCSQLRRVWCNNSTVMSSISVWHVLETYRRLLLFFFFQDRILRSLSVKLDKKKLNYYIVKTTAISPCTEFLTFEPLSSVIPSRMFQTIGSAIYTLYNETFEVIDFSLTATYYLIFQSIQNFDLHVFTVLCEFGKTFSSIFDYVYYIGGTPTKFKRCLRILNTN